jgi:hypothetical protein
MKQLLLTCALTLAGLPTLAAAQTPSNPSAALAACVVRSTNSDDSVTTMRWLFIAMSRHPSLPPGTRVSDADGLDANRNMGALVNRLLFEACANEARATVQTQGRDAAIDAAFSTLGEKAMTDLMGNADVLASVIQLGAYVDTERFDALTTPQ